jgi:hypothetical protein
MTRRSSYIIEGERAENLSCFATPIRSQKDFIVVLEKDKILFPINEIYEYLDDLTEMGCCCKEFFFLEEDRELHIVINGESSKRLKTFTCMAIRCLYEKNHPEIDYDNFVKIYKYYRKIRNRELGLNLFQKLLLAFNLYCTDEPGFNANHTFSYSEGVNLENSIKVLDKYETQTINKTLHRGFNSSRLTRFKNLHLDEKIEKIIHLTKRNNECSNLKSCTISENQSGVLS